MKKQSFVYIILAGVLWGTSGIFVNFLAPYGFTSFQMTAVRAIVSLLCVSLFVLIKDRSLLFVKPMHLLLLFGVGVSLFFTASLYYISMQMTSMSTAVVLMYMAPVYVTVYSAIFLGEKITKIKIFSIAAVIVGCALVSGIIGEVKFDALGILFGFLSGVAYAAYNILTKIAVKLEIEPPTVTLYCFAFISFISLFLIEPAKFVQSVSQAPATTLPLLIGLGTFTFVVPYFLYTMALRDIPAGVASSLSIIEPMSATLFGVIIFSEKLTLLSCIGILLILGAIFAIGYTENKKTTKE